MEKIELPNGDAFYCLNKGEAHWLYADLFEERSYFQFGFAIPAGGTVIDVGANIGLFALLASREAKAVRVISIEPLPPLYSVLRANYELHEIRGEALFCGVGKKAERARFDFYSGNTALSGRFADPEEEKDLLVRILHNRLPQIPCCQLERLAAYGLAKQSYECEVQPLSRILRERGVERVDLLKIDVEKAELDVLQGIEDADWRRIDRLVVEVHDVGDRLRYVCELLRAQGLEVQYRQGDAFRQTGLYDVFASRQKRSRLSTRASPEMGTPVFLRRQ